MSVEQSMWLTTGLSPDFCAPSQYYGHATEYDVNTDTYLDFMDNNMYGQFIASYYGSTTLGMPKDCLICACPMPYASDNCNLSENGILISCNCELGYGGARCDYCAAGYYGIPEDVGAYCKPYNCSGNIIVSDPGSCDSITGNCKKYVNKTPDVPCNLFASGFIGEATCMCDEISTQHCDPDSCDSITGNCKKYVNKTPGVPCNLFASGFIGEATCMCDEISTQDCDPGSGQGCLPCECALAADDTQCDPTTEQCRCATDVTGRHCDQCAAGYWNYAKQECDNCNYNTGYSLGFMCNATGQCECLPGVVGEKCDSCPERWVLIPQEGCLECDSCTDAPIFSEQDMSYRLTNETQDFPAVRHSSFGTTQHLLSHFWNQTQLLVPGVADSMTVEVAKVISVLKSLETSAKNMLCSAEFAPTDSDKQNGRAGALAERAAATLADARGLARRAGGAVAHVADLATGLELSQQPKVDGALAEAEQINTDIADLNIKEEQAYAAFANETAQNIETERMNIFFQPLMEQTKKFEGLVNATRELKDKLKELLECTDLAQHTADAAERLDVKNRLFKFGNKVLSVTKLNSAAMKDLIDAALDISNATLFNAIASGVVRNSTRSLEENNNSNNEIADRLARLAEELPELTRLTNIALDHARISRNRADNLRALAERHNDNTPTQYASSAASANSPIAQEIGDAKRAADEAKVAINTATNINKELAERVTPARDRSGALWGEGSGARDTVELRLQPNLTAAEAGLKAAWDTLAAADDEDNAISFRPIEGQFALELEVGNAERVNVTVKTTHGITSQLGNDLTASNDWAQTLPEQADEAQYNVGNLVNDINNLNPTISSTYRTVNMRQEELEHRRKEADEKLNHLRDWIEQARKVANRIQMGVNFDRRSTLQARLPDTVDEMSTSTHVSAYFRTREENSFIPYFGNPMNQSLGGLSRYEVVPRGVRQFRRIRSVRLHRHQIRHIYRGPRAARKRRGSTGCIRNIVIRETPVAIPLGQAGRNF